MSHSRLREGRNPCSKYLAAAKWRKCVKFHGISLIFAILRFLPPRMKKYQEQDHYYFASAISMNFVTFSLKNIPALNIPRKVDRSRRQNQILKMRFCGFHFS